MQASKQIVSLILNISYKKSHKRAYSSFYKVMEENRGTQILQENDKKA